MGLSSGLDKPRKHVEGEGDFLRTLTGIRPGESAQISIPTSQVDVFRAMVGRVFGARLLLTEEPQAELMYFTVSRLDADEPTVYGRPTYFEVRAWFDRFVQVEEERFPSLDFDVVPTKTYVIPLKQTGVNKYFVYLEREVNGVIWVRLSEELTYAEDGGGFIDGVRVSWDGTVLPDPGRDPAYLWDFIKKRLPERAVATDVACPDNVRSFKK